MKFTDLNPEQNTKKDKLRKKISTECIKFVNEQMINNIYKKFKTTEQIVNYKNIDELLSILMSITVSTILNNPTFKLLLEASELNNDAKNFLESILNSYGKNITASILEFIKPKETTLH